jgi:hypothetical protein
MTGAECPEMGLGSFRNSWFDGSVARLGGVASGWVSVPGVTCRTIASLLSYNRGIS